MREIKFRAWDKKNKRMCRVGRIEWSIDDYFVVWIEWDEKDEHREELRNLSQVDIMQYTGLKDKYGKEIYEGDIVKWNYWKNHWKNEVVKYIEVNGSDDMGTDMIGFNAELAGGEVIGNIYENKELLENKEVK